MIAYRFPTSGMAKHFARNARSRGYRVHVEDRTVTVDHKDAQLVLLAQRYVGLPVKEAKP
jgi:hypothetical protein